MHHKMYLIYVDDSGDTGLPIRDKSPTQTFVLSAVAVLDTDWLDTLDQIKQFRRYLRREFGLRIRDELKANYLIHGTGPFAALSVNDRARMRIYRQSLRFIRKVGTLTTWAVAVDKVAYEKQNWSIGVRELAWQNLLERIERFSRQGVCMLFPDEGHAEFVRQLIRRMRRLNYVSSHYQADTYLPRPLTWLVEDPNFRQSDNSYFVQLADLVAYAAHRNVYPQPYCDGSYWEQLGDCRNAKVNRLSGKGPTGIVLRPHRP